MKFLHYIKTLGESLQEKTSKVLSALDERYPKQKVLITNTSFSTGKKFDTLGISTTVGQKPQISTTTVQKLSHPFLSFASWLPPVFITNLTKTATITLTEAEITSTEPLYVFHKKPKEQSLTVEDVLGLDLAIDYTLSKVSDVPPPPKTTPKVKLNKAKQVIPLPTGYPNPTSIKVVSVTMKKSQSLGVFHCHSISFAFLECLLQPASAYDFETFSEQDAATAIHLFKNQWCKTCLKYAEENYEKCKV
jgi:hypothetical protein